MTDEAVGAGELPPADRLKAMGFEQLLDAALQFARDNDELVNLTSQYTEETLRQQAKISAFEERVRELVVANDQHRGDLLTTRQQLQNEKASSRSLLEENNRFRDQLHMLEIEVARLEGYQRRVAEFDPVSDRQQYTDRLPVRVSSHDFAGAMTSSRSEPWYRREGR